MNETRRITFMGCPLDRISLAKIITECRASLAGGRPLAIEGLNVYKLVEARRDLRLMDSLKEAGIVHTDGAGIALAGKLLGAGLPPRRAGIDLMADLLDVCQETGATVYLLGAKQEILERAADAFQQQWPRLTLAGLRNGYFKDEDEGAIAASIRATGAQLLLVGMSSPKKELFLKRHMAATGVRVAMGVGGSFDVYAGLVKRAPLWMQRSGLEWFYRFLGEPGRLWNRYLETNSIFGLLLLKAMVSPRRFC